MRIFSFTKNYLTKFENDSSTKIKFFSLNNSKNWMGQMLAAEVYLKKGKVAPKNNQILTEKKLQIKHLSLRTAWFYGLVFCLVK